MQSGRSLEGILSSIEQETLDNAKQKLNDPGQIMRVFDDFPCLIEKELMSQFQAAFQAILTKTPLSAIHQTDDGIELNNLHVRRAIVKFVKAIIHTAQIELLNENNEIKIKVRQWLQWEQPLASKEIINIVCAYVGKVNQDIMSQLDQNAMARDPEELSKVLAAVCNFITRNYKPWVEQELKQPLKISIPLSGAIGAGFFLLGAGLTLYCAKKSHDQGGSIDLSYLTKQNQF